MLLCELNAITMTFSCTILEANECLRMLMKTLVYEDGIFISRKYFVGTSVAIMFV